MTRSGTQYSSIVLMLMRTFICKLNMQGEVSAHVANRHRAEKELIELSETQLGYTPAGQISQNSLNSAFVRILMSASFQTSGSRSVTSLVIMKAV